MGHPFRLTAALLVSGALLAGCSGESEGEAGGVNVVTTNSAGSLTTGNDASAMETMTNAAMTPPAPITTTDTLDGNSAATAGETPPPLVDTDTNADVSGDTGGDTGGNTQEKQTPGI